MRPAPRSPRIGVRRAGPESAEDGSASDAIDDVRVDGRSSIGLARTCRALACVDRHGRRRVCWPAAHRGRRTGERRGEWRSVRRRRRRLRDRAVSGERAGQPASSNTHQPSIPRQCSSRAERDGRRHDGGCCRGYPGHDGRGSGWAGERGDRWAASWRSGARAGADRIAAGARIAPARPHLPRPRSTRRRTPTRPS